MTEARQSPSDESHALERIAVKSDYGIGLERASTEYCYRIFTRYLAGPEVLELGPADGVMTDKLAQSGFHVTAVEGAPTFCEDLRRRHTHITVVCSLFEDFAPDRRFNTIILGHVLEHVADPTALLRRIARWLTPGGRILAAVPNANSLHRQAAVIMGLLPDRDSLGESDARHGHRRVYDPRTFRQEFEAASLYLEHFGGYWLKPLAIAQMESTWTPEMVAAFMQLGEEYPEIAGVLYAVATSG